MFVDGDPVVLHQHHTIQAQLRHNDDRPGVTHDLPGDPTAVLVGPTEHLDTDEPAAMRALYVYGAIHR